ncbi:hypothetical protein H7H73_16685 [Mycobacterium rufum]|uniref:Uncharacterized protein n=1 Tax=Mycolicibacterium rufum TaxID=318424 RepID=A0A9X2YE36_9MYCO|nr:hypothetical protein [Mycolicibacterium rufum]
MAEFSSRADAFASSAVAVSSAASSVAVGVPGRPGISAPGLIGPGRVSPGGTLTNREHRPHWVPTTNGLNAVLRPRSSPVIVVTIICSVGSLIWLKSGVSSRLL